MIGQGDLVVADHFERRSFPYCRWRNMSENEQTEKYNAFLADSGAKSCAKQNTVVSSDGTLTVTGTNKIARKPVQRKWPRSVMFFMFFSVCYCLCIYVLCATILGTFHSVYSTKYWHVSPHVMQADCWNPRRAAITLPVRWASPLGDDAHPPRLK